MATLKRWESPRRKGRNDKGRKGTARQRQLRKRHQQLRQRLKSSDIQDSEKREVNDLSFFIERINIQLREKQLLSNPQQIQVSNDSANNQVFS